MISTRRLLTAGVPAAAVLFTLAAPAVASADSAPAAPASPTAAEGFTEWAGTAAVNAAMQMGLPSDLSGATNALSSPLNNLALTQ